MFLSISIFRVKNFDILKTASNFNSCKKVGRRIIFINDMLDIEVNHSGSAFNLKLILESQSKNKVTASS